MTPVPHAHKSSVTEAGGRVDRQLVLKINGSGLNPGHSQQPCDFDQDFTIFLWGIVQRYPNCKASSTCTVSFQQMVVFFNNEAFSKDFYDSEFESGWQL